MRQSFYLRLKFRQICLKHSQTDRLGRLQQQQQQQLTFSINSPKKMTGLEMPTNTRLVNFLSTIEL